MNLSTIILPPSKLTEGLTWMATGISIGVALGGMLAGLVIDTYVARTGFGVAIVSGLSMVVIAMIGLPIIRDASRAGGRSQEIIISLMITKVYIT
ncbi:hypothetical protein [Aeromonas piscicola]|uniref:hypothetical protein n=1 Tax=Aeromonas piscicola TaxID=600645 RepID=UPI001ADFA233|nr:hypothetical protein [Aeromonas piscicola]